MAASAQRRHSACPEPDARTIRRLSRHAWRSIRGYLPHRRRRACAPRLPTGHRRSESRRSARSIVGSRERTGFADSRRYAPQGGVRLFRRGDPLCRRGRRAADAVRHSPAIELRAPAGRSAPRAFAGIFLHVEKLEETGVAHSAVFALEYAVACACAPGESSRRWSRDRDWVRMLWHAWLACSRSRMHCTSCMPARRLCAARRPRAFQIRHCRRFEPRLNRRPSMHRA